MTDAKSEAGIRAITGTLKTRAKVDMWFRTTLGFRRIGDRWLIAHDHGSVPLNAGNSQASLGLIRARVSS